MSKKKQAEPSAQTVEVRSKPDYASVNNALLATPGHGVPCDQADCDRDAVWVMADHKRSKGLFGPKSAADLIQGGRRYVRCDRHLNYGGGE